MWQLSPPCPWPKQGKPRSTKYIQIQKTSDFHPEKSSINTPAARNLSYLEYVFNSQPYIDHQMVTECHHFLFVLHVSSFTPAKGTDVMNSQTPSDALVQPQGVHMISRTC